MILAFHSIFTAYGFWLPNEPRGSWSEFVAAWELRRFGPAMKVSTRRSIAHRPYDRGLKRQMQASLKHPPVRFTGEQAREVGLALNETPYTFHACAVMPEHVHLVVAATNRDIRQFVGHVKSVAKRALREHGWFPDHTPWVEHAWNVFFDSVEDVRRAVAYVENNPVREGKPRQVWSCVKAFDPMLARDRLGARLAPRSRRKRRG